MSIAIVLADERHGEHCPLALYADSSSPNEVPVLAEQGPGGYELTNRYADGIFGVGDEDKMEAEVDESPACACCHNLVSRWDHGHDDYNDEQETR